MADASVSIKYERKTYLKAVGLDGRPIISSRERLQNEESKADEKEMKEKKEHLASLLV